MLLPYFEKKQGIKEDLKFDLLGKALPSVTEIQALWQHDGQILLFATGKKNQMLFETLFSKTYMKHFGGILIPVLPPLMAFSSDDWENYTETGEDLLKGLSEAFQILAGFKGN